MVEARVLQAFIVASKFKDIFLIKFSSSVPSLFSSLPSLTAPFKHSYMPGFLLHLCPFYSLYPTKLPEACNVYQPLIKQTHTCTTCDMPLLHTHLNFELHHRHAHTHMLHFYVSSQAHNPVKIMNVQRMLSLSHLPPLCLLLSVQ